MAIDDAGTVEHRRQTSSFEKGSKKPSFLPTIETPSLFGSFMLAIVDAAATKRAGVESSIGSSSGLRHRRASTRAIPRDVCGRPGQGVARQLLGESSPGEDKRSIRSLTADIRRHPEPTGVRPAALDAFKFPIDVFAQMRDKIN
jgi:hypothetical protein